MQDHSENTKRIAKNTLMLYGRMLFSMVVSLYTSRVVLNTLGVIDYGIYGVVGGFVSMFSLISSSLSSAVSRFLTFELGRGDQDRLNKAFSTSLLIHIVLAIVVLVLAETVGVWFVNNKMKIPSDRLYAANWVFQASIFSFMFGLFSVPYNASIVSHERMSAFAYIGILDTTLKLLIVLFIAYSKWHFDKLIVYSLLLVAVCVSLQCVYLGYCRKNFNECRLRIGFDKEFWKEISAFAGWNFIGCASVTLKDQGVNVLLNIFFDPIVNAARGISMSINGVLSSFVGNFMTALNPLMMKSFAAGEIDYSMQLARWGARFAYFILLLIVLPFLFETQYILNLWLNSYPQLAITFVRFVLVLLMIDSVSHPLITLQLATGNIKRYQIFVGGVSLLNFPISYLFLKLGFNAEIVYLVAIIIAFMCLWLRLVLLKQMVDFSIHIFVREVLYPIIKVTIIAPVLPIILYSYMQDGCLRFIVITISCFVSALFSILFIGCNKKERNLIFAKIVAFISRSY